MAERERGPGRRAEAEVQERGRRPEVYDDGPEDERDPEHGHHPDVLDQGSRSAMALGMLPASPTRIAGWNDAGRARR
jgi:hypothetical protein